MASIGDALDGTLIWLARFSSGSSTARMSTLWMTPYTGPFALSVALRSLDAAASLRPLVGVAQSQTEITRLRSMPVGRGGACLG